MSVKVRVANPARRRTAPRINAGSLIFVNKGGKGMAVKKKARRRPAVSSHRPRARAKTNSRPRHYKARATPRATTNRRHRSKGFFALNKRRSNPKRVIHHRRRRNPGLGLGGMKNVVEMTLAGFVGMLVTDVATGFVSNMIPSNFGAFGKIGVRAFLAWGAGVGAAKLGFAKYAPYITVGGGIGAAQDAWRLLFGSGGMLFPGQPTQVVQVGGAPATAPGSTQVLLPASSTGDDSGGALGQVVLWDPGMSGLDDFGQVVTSPYPQSYFQ